MNNKMIQCVDSLLKESSMYAGRKSQAVRSYGGARRKSSPARRSKPPTIQKLSDVESEIVSANQALKTILSTFSIERGFTGRTVSIGTTPVRIVDGQFPRYYKALNASQSVGITSTGTILASASRSGSGNTQSSSLGVASYKSLRLFLDVTVAGGGAIGIDAVSKDPISGNWAESQLDLFSSPTTTGTSYVNLGDLGVDSDFAINWNVLSGSSTFSIGYALKEGLGGSGSGLARTIYLGTNEGLTVNNGFPILEGADFSFYARENTEVFAISAITAGIDLKIFELQ